MKKFSMLLVVLGLCAQGVVFGADEPLADKYFGSLIKVIIGDSVKDDKFNNGALFDGKFVDWEEIMVLLDSNSTVYKAFDALATLGEKSLAATGRFKELLQDALNDPNNVLGQMASDKEMASKGNNLGNYLKGLKEFRGDWDLGEGLGSFYGDEEEEVAVPGAPAGKGSSAALSRRARMLDAERAWRAGRQASQKVAPSAQPVKTPAPAAPSAALSRRAQILQAERAWRAGQQRR